MSKLDWAGAMNRLEALRAEIDGEVEQTPEVQPEQALEGLSATQIAALAEMLDIDAEDLLQLDENQIKQVMEELGERVVNSAYGRPGLSGKYPWSRNEPSVGYSIERAAPASSGPPSDKTAKVPKDSSSPMAMKPRG